MCMHSAQRNWIERKIIRRNGSHSIYCDAYQATRRLRTVYWYQSIRVSGIHFNTVSFVLPQSHIFRIFQIIFVLFFRIYSFFFYLFSRLLLLCGFIFSSIKIFIRVKSLSKNGYLFWAYRSNIVHYTKFQLFWMRCRWE